MEFVWYQDYFVSAICISLHCFEVGEVFFNFKQHAAFMLLLLHHFIVSCNVLVCSCFLLTTAASFWRCWYCIFALCSSLLFRVTYDYVSVRFVYLSFASVNYDRIIIWVEICILQTSFVKFSLLNCFSIADLYLLYCFLLRCFSSWWSFFLLNRHFLNLKTTTTTTITTTKLYIYYWCCCYFDS